MEFFRNAKVIRLLGRHNKYLTADDDQEDGVRQDRNGATRGAKWEVELVENRADVIRLKSCSFNRYLAASDKKFMLGAMGRKVVLLPLPPPPKAMPQSLVESVEWQPVRDGKRGVKFRTKSGTFLRANGFVKPYENTVTHGNPHRTATQDWVLWEVDVIEMNPREEPKTPPPAVPVVSSLPSTTSADSLKLRPTKDQRPVFADGFSEEVADADAFLTTSSHSRRPLSVQSDVSMPSCVTEDEDCPAPPSHRTPSVKPKFNATRFSSSPEKIGTEPPAPQVPTGRFSSSPEKFRTVPPGPQSPCFSSTPDKIDAMPPEPQSPCFSSTPNKIDAMPPEPQSPSSSSSSVSSSPSPSPGSFQHRPVLSPSPSTISPVLSINESSNEGRLIIYFFADEHGEVDDSFEGGSFEFHGSTPEELVHEVEKETGVDEFILCTRDVTDDKLRRLWVNVPLPPDHAPMTVFIVHPMSKVAKHLS